MLTPLIECASTCVFAVRAQADAHFVRGGLQRLLGALLPGAGVRNNVAVGDAQNLRPAVVVGEEQLQLVRFGEFGDCCRHVRAALRAQRLQDLASCCCSVGLVAADTLFEGTRAKFGTVMKRKIALIIEVQKQCEKACLLGQPLHA